MIIGSFTVNFKREIRSGQYVMISRLEIDDASHLYVWTDLYNHDSNIRVPCRFGLFSDAQVRFEWRGRHGFLPESVQLRNLKFVLRESPPKHKFKLIGMDERAVMDAITQTLNEEADILSSHLALMNTFKHPQILIGG